MNELQVIANEIESNLKSKLNILFKYYNYYPYNNKFYYKNYTIYDDVYNVDIKSCNLNFLKFINLILKNKKIKLFINKISSLSKIDRVVLFGKLIKEFSNRNMISNAIIGFRNIVLYKLVYRIKNNSKICLYRVNYDDFEFSDVIDLTIDEVGSNSKFNNIIKIEKYEKVIVLNKRDGVFFIKNGSLSKIKYVKDDIYDENNYFIINSIIKFILNKKVDMNMLNNDIIEAAIMSSTFKNDIYTDIRKIFSRFVPLLIKG